MKTNRQILYFGDQKDIFEFIQKYFLRKEDPFYNYDCQKISSWEEAIPCLETGNLSLLIIDFCETSEIDQISVGLNTLKKGFNNFTLPTMGIFKSKEQLDSLKGLIGMGINYCFIKGSDLMQGFNSIFYVCFEDESACSSYAIAKGFKASSRIMAPGFISRFNRFSLTVDKDIQGFGDTIEMRTNLFKDFTLTKFLQQLSYDKGFKFDTLFSEILQIEFSSGWDEGEDLMFEDTFASWMELNRETFVYKKATIFIYGESLKDLFAFAKLSLKHPELEIHYRTAYEDSRKELLKYKPELILFSVDQESSYESLNLLVDALKFDKKLTDCILYIFGHPSKSAALRKLYGKENLLASSETLQVDFAEKLFTRLEKVKKTKTGSCHFPLHDPRSLVDFPVDVEITSVTENEITFMTAVEIPYYSVLRVDEPIAMYLVVIPSLKKLSPNIHGFHYMAFICGVDFNDQDYLRQFVNYTLNNGMKKWEYIELEKHEEEKEPAASEDQEEDEKPREEKPKEAPSEMKNAPAAIRPKTKNKFSKL